MAGVLPEISGYFHPPSSVYEKRKTPAPEPGDRKRMKYVPFTFNLKEAVYRKNGMEDAMKKKKVGKCLRILLAKQESHQKFGKS